MNRDLQRVDLNLMKILKAVVETQNTHTAAEQLGVSQTTVSRGLAKLREHFGDQLFLRKAHGVEPSELAKKMAEAVDEMLNPLQKVLDSYHHFEPQNYNGLISLSVNTYLLEVFGDKLLASLKTALPNARFSLDYWQSHSLLDMLSGKIDYTLQLSNFPFPQDIYQQPIKTVKSGLLARKNHPVLTHSSAWEDIHHLPIVQFYLTRVNYHQSTLEDLFRFKGYRANIALKTHSLKAGLYCLKSTDAFCYSSRFFSGLDDELTIYPLPELPREHRTLGIVGGYLQTQRGYPLTEYLQQTMQTLFEDIVQSERKSE